MANPIAYHSNTLLLALEGKGAGTIYNSAVSATPDQTNKRFTMGTQTRIADLSGVSDDFFNGFDLYFPASDTTYHIIDWEEGLGRATVAEVPSLLDTGACQFRKALWSPNLLAANPASMACDGILNRVHKIVSTSASLDVMTFLPNLLGQCGFEELTSAFPSSEQAVGVWWNNTGGSDWSVSSTSPLLGSRMAILTVPASGDKEITQKLRSALIAGRRYRLVMKVQAVTGATGSGGLRVLLTNHLGGGGLDTDWDVQAITTSSAWVSHDFLPTSSTPNGRLTIRALFANRGAATTIRVDEVSLWDITTAPSALLAFSHNWDGAANLEVRGYYCDPSRTSVGSADYAVLSAPGTVSGSSPVLREWTVADPPTSSQAFPCYRILIPASASFQYQVGELLLGAKWAWSRAMALGIDPQERDYQDTLQRSLSGAETRILHAEQRVIKGRIPTLSTADAAIWDGPFRERHVRVGEPFAISWAGHWDTPLLLKSRNVKLPYNMPTLRDAEFEFVEVV